MTSWRHSQHRHQAEWPGPMRGRGSPMLTPPPQRTYKTPPPVKTKGRHSVTLSTPITSPSPAPIMPVFGLVRESTNLSQLSYYSEASNPGPLTRERTSLKNHWRTKTRGGTRYVVKYNDFLFRVEREDGGRITPQRSPSRNSIPDQIRFGYSARPTACGLTDPWVDLTMDTNVLPKIEDRHQTTNSPEPFSPRTARKLRKKKDAEGSTMCPQFPVVSMPTTEYDKRTIYYSDVDRLRDQLDKRKLLINRKNKDDADYKKTKQDFYRMELDSIRSMEPDKKTRMREMYFSYLQNTPGSKKAITECIKKMG